MKTLLVAFALLLLPQAVLAKDCTSDSDCDKGQQCVPSPCPMIACMPDQNCPVCTPPSTCVDSSTGTGGGGTVTSKVCAADADCPTGFTCAAIEIPCATTPSTCVCSCPACMPDADCPKCDCGPCDAFAPEACTPTTAHYCQFQPKTCTADTDCGDGYECKKDEVCSSQGCACTGCACSPCMPDAECPPCDCQTDPAPCNCPETFETTCETLGMYCNPKQVTCTTDADCVAGWQCVAGPGTGCACPACACQEGMPDCACGTCNCPAPTSYCMPAGWADLGISTPTAALEAATGHDSTTGGGTLNGNDATTYGNADAATTAPTSTTADDGTKAAGTAATTDTGKSGCRSGGSFVDILGLLGLALITGRVLRRKTVRA